MEPTDKTPPINNDYFESLTGEIPKSGQRPEQGIGGRIKKIREEKGISLEALSKMTGFDREILSRIEKNETQPQLGTVIKLSKALDSAFSRLISDAGDKLYSVTRKDDRKPVQRSTSQKGKKELYIYKSLAPEVKGRHMEALIVQLTENLDEEASVHAGEEFIFVLDGDVSMKIGEDRFDLEPGDSIYYLSTTPHWITAKKDKATILAVLYEG